MLWVSRYCRFVRTETPFFLESFQIETNQENKHGVIKNLTFIVSTRSGLGTWTIGSIFLTSCSLLVSLFWLEVPFATLEFETSTGFWSTQKTNPEQMTQWSKYHPRDSEYHYLSLYGDCALLQPFLTFESWLTYRSTLKVAGDRIVHRHKKYRPNDSQCIQTWSEVSKISSTSENLIIILIFYVCLLLPLEKSFWYYINVVISIRWNVLRVCSSLIRFVSTDLLWSSEFEVGPLETYTFLQGLVTFSTLFPWKVVLCSTE